MPPTRNEQIRRVVYMILGRPSQQRLHYRDVDTLVIQAAKQVLRTIVSNPNHPYLSSLMQLVTIGDGEFLPKHEGEPGIPLIVPFPGAEPRAGIPADPDEIDSYKNDLTSGPGYKAIYSGAVDQRPVACNEATAKGRVSPTACRYSIKDGLFRFTGDSAQVPLIIFDTAADPTTQVPTEYDPALLRLAISWMGQPWDKFYPICVRFAQESREDLRMIAAGSRKVNPIEIEAAA
jgi:hypothetical protein